MGEQSIALRGRTALGDGTIRSLSSLPPGACQRCTSSWNGIQHGIQTFRGDILMISCCAIHPCTRLLFGCAFELTGARPIASKLESLGRHRFAYALTETMPAVRIFWNSEFMAVELWNEFERRNRSENQKLTCYHT